MLQVRGFSITGWVSRPSIQSFPARKERLPRLFHEVSCVPHGVQACGGLGCALRRTLSFGKLGLGATV